MRRVGCGWLVGAMIVPLLTVPTRADVPVPPAASAVAHRVAEYLPSLATEIDRMGAVTGALVESTALERCASVAWDDVCGTLDLAASRRAARRCRAMLARVHEALDGRAPPADEDTMLAVVSMRQRVGTEAMRLSSLLRVLSHSGCAAAGTSLDDVPAAVTLLDGGRRALIEPERGLVPGRDYALVTRPSGVAVKPTVAVPSLPDTPGLAAARARLHALGRSVSAPDTWPAFPAFVVALPASASLAPFWHPPVRVARASAETPHAFRVRDPRLPGPSSPVTCAAGAVSRPDLLGRIDPRDGLADLRHGRLPAPADLAYLVTLPRGRVSAVVLLAHSLMSEAMAMLAATANAFGREGIASVAFDLPLHGARVGEEEFLSPDDLAAYARHALRAAEEVVALAEYVRRCPGTVGLPPATPTTDVGFVGYSIGASVGLLALATDPRLRPAVLMAPAGDVGKWQGLLAAGKLGLLRRVCIGAHPGSCATDADCAGGRCEHHPGLWLVPTALGPASRLLVGDAEPLGVASFLRPPADTRPVLVQLASDDTIVFAPYARRVADALALPMAPPGGVPPSRAVTVWTGGHAFVHTPAVLAEAAAFLSRGSAPPPDG